MNLGALLDVGVPFEHLEAELTKLGLSEHYRLTACKRIKLGIEGTKFDVELVVTKHQHDCDHKHEHTHHTAQAHGPSSEHHEHRSFSDVKAIIENSSLAIAVKSRAIAIFHQLAVAEAKVHGKTEDEVHFHEVGAIDAIVDIVGAAICLEYLQVEAVYALPPEVGSGFVKCAHGLMPVPAPATAELLTGIPFTQRLKGEATTPTGATILRHLVKCYYRPEALIVEKIGYGLGTKDFEQPNVLRVYLGTVDSPGRGLERATQYLVETNIDDQNPEFFGDTEARLFAAGAVDVYRTPIYMKKGRLGVKLSILYPAESEQAVLDVVFRETTTIGLRRTTVDKLMLERKFVKIETPLGTISVKQAYYKGQLINQKPEYEDLQAIALTNGLTIKALYTKILPYVEA
ncbi:MAG: hypothetical protein FD169_560 [Bacillota bacterium]|nr:MAG: hypothetical protein FD169_560 [Bacillota bacterium]